MKRLPRGHGGGAPSVKPQPSAAPLPTQADHPSSSSAYLETHDVPERPPLLAMTHKEEPSSSAPQQQFPSAGRTPSILPEFVEEEGFVLVSSPDNRPIAAAPEAAVAPRGGVGGGGLFARVLSLPAAALALPYSGLHSSIKRYIAPPSASSKAREDLRRAVAQRAAAAAAAVDTSSLIIHHSPAQAATDIL